MATFLEGVESVTLACSLVVLVPTLVVVLTARGSRVALVAGTLVGTSVMMWARAGRLWEWDADGAARWLIGLAILATFGAVARAGPAAPIRMLAFGVAAGLVTGWLWQPCVGEHFAEVLNRAESDRVVSLAKMHLYVTGLFAPVIAVVALPHAFPRLQAPLHHRGLAMTGIGLSVVYAITVVAGWYDDLVGELFRISSN